MLDLIENSLQTFLKFAAELGASYQRAHVQGINAPVSQIIRYVTGDNALRQPFGNSGFTHARLADQNRVILGFSAENADHVPDLPVTANHRIKLLLLCQSNKIACILAERLIGIFRIIARHARSAAYCIKRRQKVMFIDRKTVEQCLYASIRRRHQTHEKVLDREILILHPLCDSARLLHGFIHILGYISLVLFARQAFYTGKLFNFLKSRGSEQFRIPVHLRHQLADQALGVFKQSI